MRDRESYEFALASAAVALDLQNGTVRKRAHRAGRRGDGAVARERGRSRFARQADQRRDRDAAAADAAFAGAKGHGHNEFKIELGKRTLSRALQQAAALEI